MKEAAAIAKEATAKEAQESVLRLVKSSADAAAKEEYWALFEKLNDWNMLSSG